MCREWRAFDVPEKTRCCGCSILLLMWLTWLIICLRWALGSRWCADGRCATAVGLRALFWLFESWLIEFRHWLPRRRLPLSFFCLKLSSERALDRWSLSPLGWGFGFALPLLAMVLWQEPRRACPVPLWLRTLASSLLRYSALALPPPEPSTWNRGMAKLLRSISPFP